MSDLKEIQIDLDKAGRPLGIRERISIKILLTVFAMIYPAKWPHEVREFINFIIKDLEK